MRYPRLEALRGYLVGLGSDVSDDALRGLIEIVENEPEIQFEAGDIVMIYEGMGEHSYARVLGRKSDGYYRVRAYEYEGKWADYQRTVRLEANQLSTLTEADEYYSLRMGKKK